MSSDFPEKQFSSPESAVHEESFLKENAFSSRFKTVDGVRLHYLIGGNPEGKVLLLLAGFPQSCYAWRHILPLLSEQYRIIVPDLPGQGDSDCPMDGYDTVSLATSIHGLLSQLDVRQLYVAGHDIGAWVAFTFAALFKANVQRLALLDAGIPGVTMPDAVPNTPDKAWRVWHFPFHSIPDLPEILIAGKEREYLDWFLKRKAANPDTFSEADLKEYRRVFCRPGGLRAGLSYYRRAEQSTQQNRELMGNNKLPMPVLALSSDQGSIPDMAGPLAAFAETVQGFKITDCGHYLPEEQPHKVAEQFRAFFH